MNDRLSLPSISGVSAERGSLTSFLDYQRAVIARKVVGVDAEGLRVRLEPSSLTLGGIIQHLTDVERFWFRDRLAGEDGLSFRWSKDDPDGEFRLAEDVTATQLVDAYLEEIDRCREAIVPFSLDDLARRPPRRQVTLRWILVHMIEETARHAGHADLLRETVDGSVGD